MPEPDTKISKHVSIYLDLLRGAAALVVLLSHACRPELAGALLPNLEQAGKDAVVVFFVLSGFVISYTATTKERLFSEYIVNRLARLWSVAIPAIILAAGLGSLGVLLAPAVYSSGGIRPDNFGSLHIFGRFINDWPALRLLFGLLFLNEFWSTTIIVFKNAPYWSISFEFCYYLLFGSWFYLRGMPRILAILVTALLYGPRVLLLMPIWILGVVIYRLRPRVPSGWAWIFILVPAGAYLVLFAKQAWLLAWRTDALIPLNLVWADRFAWQYCVGLLMAANLIGFRSLASSNLLLKFERPIRWMASRTLSVYLFHFPILFFLGAVCQRLGLDRYSRGVLILCVTFLAIEVLSRLTEARRRDWRTALQRAVGIQTGG